MERNSINLFSGFLISSLEIFGSKLKTVHASDEVEWKAQYFLLLETASSFPEILPHYGKSS